MGRTHWADTNRVMLRNRRIGCSVSGVAQFVTNRGLDVFKEWLNKGYDTIQEWDNQYSDWFAVPKSIKTTSVKPSGTVSLLAGATPGLHYPESRFYIRRIRISKHSELIEPFNKVIKTFRTVRTSRKSKLQSRTSIWFRRYHYGC